MDQEAGLLSPEDLRDGGSPEDSSTTRGNTSRDSFATCLTSPDATFLSCISDDADTSGGADTSGSDLERTIISSTPTKRRQSMEVLERRFQSIESIGSADAAPPEPATPRGELSEDQTSEGEIVAVTSENTFAVPSETESAVAVPSDASIVSTVTVINVNTSDNTASLAKEDNEEENTGPKDVMTHQTTTDNVSPNTTEDNTSSTVDTSSVELEPSLLPRNSSVLVIGPSAHALAPEHFKERNSLSNVSVLSSASSILVLGSSSQSQDCFTPDSLALDGTLQQTLDDVISETSDYSNTDNFTLVEGEQPHPSVLEKSGEKSEETIISRQSGEKSEETILSSSTDKEDCTEEPRDCTEEPRDCTEEPHDCTEEPRDCTEEPRDCTEEPRDCTEEPRDCTEEPRDCTEEPREPEIHRNMYPEVKIKPSLQINVSELEALKFIDPVEYSSSVESSPDIGSRGLSSKTLPPQPDPIAPDPIELEGKLEGDYPELSYESDITLESGGRTPMYRSGSVLSTASVKIDEKHVASDVLVSRLASVLPREDVQSITKKQKYMLNKLECSNEKIRSCCQLSAQQFDKSSENFKYYTKLLVEMRRDVDTAFKRIHSIKTKLARSYPVLTEMCANEVHTDYVPPDVEDEAAFRGATFSNVGEEGCADELSSAERHSIEPE